MSTAIQETKLSAFLRETQELSGIVCRPPTMATMLALMETGNVLLRKELAGVGLKELIQGVAQYLILHSRPLEEVRKLVDGGGPELGAAMLDVATQIPAGSVE